MTLTTYNKKILEFIYELSKLNRVYSYRELAKRVRIQGKEVSAKTIQSWLEWLDQPYERFGMKKPFKLLYYPVPIIEKIGLSRITALFNTTNPEIISEIKTYSDFTAIVSELSTLKKKLFVQFLVPKKREAEFIKNLKQKYSLIISFTIQTNTGYLVVNPLHKIIEESGNHVPENLPQEWINQQSNKVLLHLERTAVEQENSLVKKNQFIIPVIFEYGKHFRSSTEVWQWCKTNIGEPVWKYLPRIRIQTDAMGIHAVQKAIEQTYIEEIIFQTRMEYIPLALENNFYSYIHFNLINTNKQTLIIELIKNSITSRFYKTPTGAFVILLTNAKAFNRLLSIFSEQPIQWIGILQHEESLPLLTDDKYNALKYYEIFDAEKKEWK